MSEANTVTNEAAATSLTQGQPQTAAEAADARTEAAVGAALAGKKRLTGVAKMARDFEKSDRVYAVTEEELKDLAAFAQTLGEGEEPGFLDWAEKAPETFSTMALVKAENGDVRAISIASPDAAFNNPAVREYCYEAYISRVLRSARAADAVAEMFTSPDGSLKVAFDKSAWDFQKDAATEQFNGKLTAAKAGKAITAAQFKRCLSDATFAEDLFPKLSDQTWERILDQLAKYAESKNYDASIFRHWKITRHMSPEMSDATDETFADFGLAAVASEGEVKAAE